MLARLDVADQVADLHVKGIGNQFQCSQRHALLAGFDPVQMDAVQPGQLRQLVLRQALLGARGLDVSADNFLNVLQRLQPRVYAALKHPA